MAANVEQAFKIDSTTAGWVLSGYALTLGSFIMVFGKIADIIGPHNLYLIGLTTLWICALICAVIPSDSSIIILIVFRAIQGIGAATLIPSTMSIAANYFSGANSKYLTNAIAGFLISLTGTLGIGLILGGAFAETNIGYKGFFYLVFALGIVCDILLFFIMIPIEKTEGHHKLKMKNIDFIGSFLIIAGTLLIILGLVEGGDHWRNPKAIAPLIIGFFTFISSIIFEVYYIKRYQDTHKACEDTNNWRLNMDLLFPPELVKIPNFITFLVMCGIYYATFIMMLALGVQYYIFVENNSAILAAIKVFPLTFGLVLGATIYRPFIYSEIGIKNMLLISTSLTLGCCVWFSRNKYGVIDSYWKFGFFALFFYGIGMNIYFNIYLGEVVKNTPLHLQGVVAGIYNACCQILLSIGNVLIPSIMGNIAVATNNAQRLELHNKFQTVFYVVMGFHAVGLLVILFFYKK